MTVTKRTILFCLLLMIAFSNAMLAQCDFEKQKEIKLSEKYYYGEGINIDTTVAKSIARTELMNQIANAYLNTNRLFSKDSALYIPNIQYCVSKYGSKYLSIAYAEKGAFNSKKSKELKVVKMNFTEGLNVSPISTKLDEKQPNLIQNNVMDSIYSIYNGTDLKKFLVLNANKDKLIYTAKESLVENTSDCYIVILDKKTDQILGCLNKEQPYRRNILDSRQIKDHKIEFPKANYIWVYVY